MGHYYADLMCDRCGKIRCICPPSNTVNNDDQWVVDHSFNVVTIKEFDEANSTITTRFGKVKSDFKVLKRVSLKRFDSKEEAELEAIRLMGVHRKKLIEEISEIENKMARLSRVIDK